MITTHLPVRRTQTGISDRRRGYVSPPLSPHFSAEIFVKKTGFSHDFRLFPMGLKHG